MSHLVLARKYRPQGFSSVTGQDHITRTLANSINRDKIAHAYLFCGPRGVGKTSMARIFAKALNCIGKRAKGAVEPCLSCTNCTEIARGTSIAVREIDGASHNSVDNVRELIDSFRSAPPPGNQYKIYIIDEVHMLSASAFNALLKSLEEPPPNTIFILATTEAHKIPETVLSRCQRHDFRVISEPRIIARLKEILEQEKIAYEEGALQTIAKLADGSMRDGQTILERAMVFCQSGITDVETAEMLGVVNRSILLELVGAILSRDCGKALKSVNQVFAHGLNLAGFLREFVLVFRDLVIIKLGEAKALHELSVNIESYQELNELIGKLDAADFKDLFEVARVGADSALRSSYVRHGIEALVVRMATREPAVTIGAALHKVLNGSTNTGASARQAASRAVSSSSFSSGQGRLERRTEATSSITNSTTTNRLSSSSEISSSALNIPKAIVSSDQSPRGTSSEIDDTEMEYQLGAADYEGNTALDTKPKFTSSAELPPIAAGEIAVDWDKFVEFVVARGSRVLGNTAKMLRCESVTANSSGGELVASGNQFTISALDRTAERTQLESLLGEFTGQPRWRVSLKKAVAEDGSGKLSISEREQQQKAADRKRLESEILARPEVLALSKVFEGSSVIAVESNNTDE